MGRNFLSQGTRYVTRYSIRAHPGLCCGPGAEWRSGADVDVDRTTLSRHDMEVLALQILETMVGALAVTPGFDVTKTVIAQI